MGIIFIPIIQVKTVKSTEKSLEVVCTLYDYMEIHLVLNNAVIFKNQIALKFIECKRVPSH